MSTMQKLHFSILINAPKEKVWKTMLDDKTYRQWTEPFGQGSYYSGDWSEGSKILFLAPSDKGEMGMSSRIRSNKPYEFLSIEHIGEIHNGKEVPKDWAGAQENYTFKSVDGKTEVLVDLDSVDEFKEMFQDIWPKALQRLKELAEE